MKYFWTIGLTVGLLALVSCGGSRKQKAATVKKESTETSGSSTIPDIGTDNSGSLDQYGYPGGQQQPGTTGSQSTFGSVDQQRQQMEMQELFRKQEEENSFGGMAAKMLPSILGGFMGGGGGGNPLAGMFSGATGQGAPAGQAVNPAMVSSQQTYYQQAPQTAAAAVAGPDQSSMVIPSQQTPGMASYFQQ